MNTHLHNYDPATVTYPDDYLNHWSDVYADRRIRDYGIELTYFLVAPERILEWIEQKRLRPLSELASADAIAGVRAFIGRRAVDRALNGAPVLADPKARH